MDKLDEKLIELFPGRVVRKDLVKRLKANASVPSYVLEYLLAQNCLGFDDEGIEEGVEQVRKILEQHYVQRDEAGLVRSRIRETGLQTVIDKVSVSLNEKRNLHEAKFENLGIEKVYISDDKVEANKRMLVSPVWCIAKLGYVPTEAKDESPFILQDIKAIQIPGVNLDAYIEQRSHFTMDEWIDVLIRSIGLDPEQLSRRSKLFQLTRLVSYCERNYNFIELGPKGTGKSHVFNEFSPHGILISGGEVTPAKLFVNNSTGKIGLVGYWDVVAFDEFAGKTKRVKADIVDIMKNYMANKSFSRGIDQVTAEASMAFVGNTSHDVSYMIQQTDLLEDLPGVYRDSAFIDRFHAYIPGWELEIVRNEMYCNDCGFVVDYLAEALRAMRSLDYSGLCREQFELSESLSTRDRDGVIKTYSGLMKIIFPGKDAEVDEAAELLEFALELRKRVKDTLLRMDETFDRSDFSYRPVGGEWRKVLTLEELDYPAVYHALDKVPYCGSKHPVATLDMLVRTKPAEAAAADEDAEPTEGEAEPAVAAEPELYVGCIPFREGQRNVSFERLFGPYLEGAHNIEIIDPYIRLFHQCRNLMETLETCLRHFDHQGVMSVHLTTAADDDPVRQADYLRQIAEAFAPMGLEFTWDIDTTGTIHARHFIIDDKWDILLDRGLDIFQRYDDRNAFALENRMPETRRVKRFEVVYMRKDREGGLE